VFCGQCGENLPDDAKFCQSCGRRTTPASTSAIVAKAADHVLSSSPEPTARVPGPSYGWFAFAMACFTVCAAGIAFQICAAAATLDLSRFDKVGGSTDSIMGLLFAAVWAARTWKRIQAAEPESDGEFRRKHRSLLLKLSGAVSVSLLIACGLGVSAGHKQRDTRRFVQAVVELNRDQTEVDKHFMQTFTYGNLRQPASFSSPEVAANSLAEFEEYASASENVMRRKESLLAGHSVPVLTAQFESARVMISATEELYRYASEPSRNVHIETGVVVIGGVDEFNKRAHASNVALQKFNLASAALSRAQGLSHPPNQ